MDVRSESLLRVALRVWITIGGLALLVAAWWALRGTLGLVLPPLAIAAVIIYLLNPGVSALQRRGVARPLGTLLAYVTTAAAGWFLLSVLGPLLVEQVRGLIDELPSIGASIQTTVNDLFVRLGLPPDVRLDLQPETLGEELSAFLTTNQEQVLGLLRGAGSVVSWVLHLAVAVTVGPIIAFYALADLPRLGAGARRLLPPERRPEVVEVSARIARIVGRYFRGQLLVATFVGAATAAGLGLIGLPFWAVVGLTAGVFNVIPLVGPMAGGIFGVLIALTVGDGLQQALLVILIMVAVQQIDNHLITPVVVSRSVAIHPITVILALIVASSIGGIPAMVIAIPTVAVCKLVLLHVVVTRVPAMAHLTDDQEDDGRRMRPGAVTDLAKDLRRSFERRLALAAMAQRTRIDDEDELVARQLHPTAAGAVDGSAEDEDDGRRVTEGGAIDDVVGADDTSAGTAGDETTSGDLVGSEDVAPGGEVSRPAGVAPPT